MRKIVILLVVVGLLAGGAFVWYAHGSGSSKTPFRADSVVRGDLLATISATGTLEPTDVVDVGAQVAGQIQEFGTEPSPWWWRPGKPIDYRSAVEPGTVLARIDERLYKAKVDQSRALLVSAKTKVDQAKAQYDSYVTKVDQAKANVQRSDADLKKSRAMLDQAERDWDRARKLGPADVISKLDYDTAKATYETSLAGVGVSEAALAQAKAAVTDAEAAVVNAKAAIADAEAAVGTAQAVLNQDEINLSYCTIKSPVKGVVIDRRVTIGQTVQSSFNTPSLFLIALDLQTMKVWASVNEADINNVHVGQTVRFTVDACPGETFTGKVHLIRLNATMTQNVVTYTVEVVTDNTAGKLLPYMTANLQFEVDKRSNALLVSNAALRWKPQMKQIAPEARQAYAQSLRRKEIEGAASGKEAANQGVVWVEEGGFVKPVNVRLGLTDGNQTEVLEGDLTEGAKMVTGEAVQGGGDDTTNPFAPKIFGGKKSS
jgi:HlyD family secretion protein